MAQPDSERRIAGTGINHVDTGVNGMTSGLAPRFETLPNGDVRRGRDVSRRFTPTPGAGTEVVLDPSRPKSAARELGRAISGARTVTRDGRSLPDISRHSWSDDWGPDVLGPDIQPDSGFISQGTFDAIAEGVSGEEGKVPTFNEVYDAEEAARIAEGWEEVDRFLARVGKSNTRHESHGNPTLSEPERMTEIHDVYYAGIDGLSHLAGQGEESDTVLEPYEFALTAQDLRS